jgi:oligoendopeptidase F
MAVKQSIIPTRKGVHKTDQWDLSKLYSDSEAWMADVSQLEKMITNAGLYRGTLQKSAQNLLAGLNFLTRTRMLIEKLSYYAFLLFSGDTRASENQERQSLMVQIEARSQAALSFFEPELLKISKETYLAFAAELSELESYQTMINKLLRMKPHTLPEKEEHFLALFDEPSNTIKNTFSLLVNADMDFGIVETAVGSKQLSRQNLSWFLVQPDRDLRRRAYIQYYKMYENHEHTLASLYTGSIQKDVYLARIRNYPSARASALFKDNIPESVYDTIVDSVHEELPLFHEFFRMKKELLGYEVLHPYDFEIPLTQSVSVDYSYEKAVETVIAALEPFGKKYTETLRHGLLNGWVDRYENKGKRAGAFTAACYSGEPYILLNYKPSVLRNLFTLAHESGHAMHSWYSIRSNPFQHYEYSVLEAETAANVHERLLYDYLLNQAEDEQHRAYLLERLLNDITAKIFRQSMLAEFEHIVHTEVEIGKSVTTAKIRKIFRNLSTIYYGPDVTLDVLSDLEGLTVPHFYQAYYVYTYAVGAAAALSLSQGILSGKDGAICRYMDFLRSGGSEYPIQALSKAGVNITSPESVKKAFSEFSILLNQFKSIKH